MIELRLHHELYDGFAVDEAVKVYQPFAGIELEKTPTHYLLRVTAADGEAEVARELLNFALGKTVERRGAPGGQSA